MDEPSILDYLKSKLKFWKRGGKIEIPSTEPSSIKPGKEERKDTKTSWPWRSFLALGFSLAGQRCFEPPTRVLWVGIFLYIAAIGVMIWAYKQGEWVISQGLPSQIRDDPMTYRRIPLILALISSLMAFLTLGGNLFTPINVLFWVGAITCFVWAFWLRKPEKDSLWTKIKLWTKRQKWEVPIDRWAILVVLVSILVIFFRVYHISQTPGEPFSDHAEKILDVYDITQGKTHIFFPRNTGREGIQMYLTVAISWLFGTGLSFLSLKIGTVLCGLATLPFVYLLGKEFGGKRVGLLALFFTGIAYWPNVISRVGLRFPLYPLFVAPTLLYLIRGLKSHNRNDFILSGLFLGLGLNGYTPYRIVPLLVLFGFGLYLLHRQSKGIRTHSIIWFTLLVIASFIVFLPLLRYALEHPGIFSYRAFTRLESLEQPLPGAWWKILITNLGNAIIMFNWNDGEIWVNSVTHRPALDIISAAFFIIGIILLSWRYVKKRNWEDLFLILSIPILQLPSSLSLAFPNENPALNRSAGAIIPVFIVVAMAFEGFITGIKGKMQHFGGKVLLWIVTGLLIITSVFQNYDLVFHQYDEQYRLASWNSSEMGTVIKLFGETFGSTNSVWIVPFPYWVDTRLPGIWAGIPNRDFVMWQKDIPSTVTVAGPKLFIVKADVTTPEFNDQATLDLLKRIFPQGSVGLYSSKVPNHDFWIYFVPAQQ